MNLYEAAEKGYLLAVEKLVADGAEVDKKNSGGLLELVHCLY